MNKARMTFRFNDREPREQSGHNDPQGREDHIRRENKEQAKVIPMRTEEYHVIKEQPEQGPGNESKEQRFEVKPLNEYTTDFGGWHSTLDTDTYRLQEDSSSSERMTVDPETGYVDREWKRGRGQTREHRAYKTKDSVYFPNPAEGSSWMKITASVAGAVVTGIAFGFLVLSMFSGGGSDSAGVQPVNGTTAPKQQGEARVQDNRSSEAEASGAAATATATATEMAVNLPARTYTFVQGGVFSSSQSADSAIADFRGKGLAAASDAGDKYPVYVGMALSRDEALGLTREFQQRQLEVMIKPFEIPAAAKIKWNHGQNNVFQSYMNQGAQLVQQMASQTIIHLGEENPAALDQKVLQALKSTHQSWSGTASAVSDGLGETGRAALPKMNSALNTAVVSLEEYHKNPSKALLWEAQTALMQYLVAEKELLKSVSVH